MSRDKTRSPVLRFDSDDLDPELVGSLRSLEVELSVYRPGEVRVILDDRDRDRFAKLPCEIGSKVEVLLPGPGTASKLTKVFTGQVTGLGVEDDGGYAQVRIEAHDARHRFALSSRVTTYVNSTVKDVLSAIAKAYGLQLDLQARTEKAQDWLLQPGTDYAFVSEIAANHGCDWYVEDGTLRVAPVNPAPAAEASYDDGSLLSFSAMHSSATAIKEVEVRGWDVQQRQAIVGRATVDPDEGNLGSGAGFAETQYKAGQGVFGRTVQISSRAVRTHAEATRLAQAYARRWATAGLEVEGEVRCNPKVRVGGRIAIKGVAAAVAGSYQVTEVLHRFGEGHQATTSFSTRREDPDVPGVGQPDGWLGVGGVVTGVVTDNVDPDRLGRVKVKLPTLGDTIETDWARLLAFGAGKGRGFDVRPEVNDEVLVTFENGDPRSAVVLGGVFSDGAGPPRPGGTAVAAEETDRWAVRSRSGQHIVFSDVQGDESKMSVVIAVDNEKTKLEIRQDGILVEAEQGKPLVLRAGEASLTLTDKGDVQIDGQKVQISAKQGIEVKGQTLELEGQTGVTLESKTKLEAKGALVEVSGEGMTKIKGGMVNIN